MSYENVIERLKQSIDGYKLSVKQSIFYPHKIAKKRAHSFNKKIKDQEKTLNKYKLKYPEHFL